MSTAQTSDSTKSVQLGWHFGVTTPQNLSGVLENKARSLRGAASLILPYPELCPTGSEFVAVGFRELVIEQNAWVNYLSAQDVRKGDEVVVWLSNGPCFIAVIYALFKIGAHAIVLDPEFSVKTGYDVLQGIQPRHMVGTRATLAYAKHLGNEGDDPVNEIEVENPRVFVGSAIRAFQTRLTVWEEDAARLTLMRTNGQRCSCVSFDQEQLCQLAFYYKDWFGLMEGDRAVPGNLLEALLFPAAGLATIVVSERFSDSSFQAARLVKEASEQFGLQLVSGDARFWRSIARLAARGMLPRGLGFKAIVHGSEWGDCGLDTLNSEMPEVDMNLVFGSACNPFVAARKFGDCGEQRGEVLFRGLYVGKPLPGLQVSLLPSRVLRWADESGAATPLGEIATARQDYAPLGDRECWAESGELGFFDYDGGLWHCGCKEDVIATSYGGFCPVRCESVFNRHPRVKRSALIALRKDGKTRAGLVVETSLGEIPKRGLEERRFKAELIQLGMDIEETSLVADIFFSDRLPLEEGSLEGVDRKRLSKEYSRRLRF